MTRHNYASARTLIALRQTSAMTPTAAALFKMGIRAEGTDTDIKAALASWKTEMTAFKAAVDAANAASAAALAAQGTEVKAAVQAANAAVDKVAGFAANLLEIEKKIADAALSDRYVPHASVGAIVVGSAEYKAAIAGLSPGTSPGAGFKLRIEANTITGQEGSPPASSDTLVPIDRRPGIVPGAFRALKIRDLIPTIPTVSNAWQFTRELAFTNNAAEVAEGAAKAESVLTFEDATVNIRTIAHFIKASNQILADAPALRAYIDGRLRYGVELREETQIIAGDGVGQNLSGMTKSGNYTAFSPASGDTALDSLNKAKYLIVAADYQATGIVMNPTNWGAIERLKDSTNRYIVGDPFGAIVPVVWGLPIVVTNSMTANKLLVADFATSYEYAERQSTVIDLGFVNDDFTKNLVTIRGEKRGALATIRPSSAYYGNLTL